MKVEVVEYNPEWKNLYNSEAQRIQSTCGKYIFTIEHAGSTSVEGLASKPVIDIYIGTKSIDEANSMIEPMKSLGYEYIEKFESELPFRRFFTRSVEDKKLFHIHVTPAPHIFRRDDLMFRDYISSNKKARKDYEELKIKLSKHDWDDSMGYNKAKTDFCIGLKAKALEFFGKLFEETESEATFLMHSYAAKEERDRAQFSMKRDGNLTAIRTDIFPGFSLNRTLGIEQINEKFLERIENFYEGKPGKFALQIPPWLVSDEKKALLASRNYEFANSWVTFYKDSSPILTRGTDLEIREIGKEHAATFAHNLNEVFGFPHQFDAVAASAVGKREWITFMAFDGNIAAGSASICIVGKCAYLSFANVLPAYRNRGIQGELLKLRIDAARNLGAKWIVVDTAETGPEHYNPSYWNMLRHGFRLLYHRPNYVKIQ